MARKKRSNMRRTLVCVTVFAVLCGAFTVDTAVSQGIAPEQIYQPALDHDALLGPWEALPEDNPLAERKKGGPVLAPRMMMTLRKDGTCRIFDNENPSGADGLWTVEDHELYVTFQSGAVMEFFVYGVKGDFMVTRSPIKAGRDQLWSRVR
jgi:hypothetical protein